MCELNMSLGSVLETFYLNIIPGMAESILEAKSEPMEEAIIYEDAEEW